ncbi:exopolysaccharide transport family protein [Methylobacterium sp. Leaf466]|uniref:exopolysaccharide transport family protein n=1 Tax=Methylobacterium sp. Leaf466 TaxID=1736386 RepID=UPI0006F23009|nr:exopolysaccharide transport family protein [Methylobacterium sp. Leaf466]KQT88975.1 lipopolysaccharide biosynthesis protein [Methylobacterium sp. Leaf466]
MPRTRLHPAPLHAAQGHGDGLGLTQVGGLLRRSWAWIALPTLAAAAGAIVFVQVVPPRYTGEAKILLENREAAFSRSGTERAEASLPIDEQAVASQVQVVMSRDLAREAVRRLKLAGNAEFDPSVDGVGVLQSMLIMTGLAKNPLDRTPEDRVLETYFERLLVYSAGKSRILTIEFRSRDAELAARAANTVAELYIASLEAAKVDTARYASTWLGGNIESLRKRVAEAEAKVETYRSRNGLIATGGTSNQPLGAQQLGEISTQLSQARTVKADLAGRAKLIKEMIKDGRVFEIPDVANNEVIRRAVEQRITLKAQLALESRTLLPAHPRIKELVAQVNDLDAQIKATADRVVRTLENDARIAEARVESLTAAVEAQRDVVAQGNSSEVQLRALEREAKAEREQLESYLSRYREASARDAESATPADARVVSRAVVPELPSFPKKLPIIALATLLALMFSIGAILARHLLANPEGVDGGRRRDEDEDAAERQRPFSREPGPFDFPEASAALSRSGATYAGTAYAAQPPAWAASVARVEDEDRREAPAAEPDGLHREEPSIAIPAQVEDVRDAARVRAPVVPTEAEELPVILAGPPLAGPPSDLAQIPAQITATTPAMVPAMVPAAIPLPPPAAAPEEALAAAVDEPAAPQAAPARSDAAFQLDLLVARLREGGEGHTGPRVVVVETGEGGEESLAQTLAATLSASGSRTLVVDLNGPGDDLDEPGVTDLVAGEVAFHDAIQPIPGSRLHVIARGSIPAEILIEEPLALTITLDALDEAYAWVVCRIDAARGWPAREIMAACIGPTTAVVIASNAEAHDPALVDLYARAEDAGAALVVVAQDRPAVPAETDSAEKTDLGLRLSAA